MNGFFFPYKPSPYRNTSAPMVAAPSWHAPEPVSTLPTSYNSKRRTVDVIAATSNPHRSQHGLTVFQMNRKAADLDLVDCGLIPVLDSHDHGKVLGKVVDAWIDYRQLYATLRFSKDPAGLFAADMVRRGEITGVSVGVSIRRWRDEAGNPVTNDLINDPRFSTWGRAGGPSTFTAVRWALVEISLTSCPADKEAVIL
jgi:phage head maturation protease